MDVIKRTFQATTQFARSGWITGHIYNTHRAPFPALNVSRRNEAVATDTIFADVAAIDDGSLCAQLFLGVQSRWVDAYGMKSDSQFVHTLLDVIRKRGAMDKLISDNGKAQVSTKVKDVLRHLFIDDWQSEAYYQHQNPLERRYQNIKFNVNHVLNMTGAPAYCWLLCLYYVIFIIEINK